MKFACIAEATAQYYKLGYQTVSPATAEVKVMVKPGRGTIQTVQIRKLGFLDVEAKHLSAREAS